MTELDKKPDLHEIVFNKKRAPKKEPPIIKTKIKRSITIKEIINPPIVPIEITRKATSPT